MSIFAISDLHLTFSHPEKTMEIFGFPWEGYMAKIKKKWQERVTEKDLVLLCGDTSWALKLERALIDLRWIDSLPGTKIIIKGNHDFWWPSLKKLKENLPKSIHPLQNDVYYFNDVIIGGARLWESAEYNFDNLVGSITVKKISAKDERIFEKELQRLSLSLSKMERAKIKIAMTHFPPIASDLRDSKASKILEKFGIKICVFGHLHDVTEKNIFGEKNGIHYFLTSCDYLDFTPLKIL